MGDDSGTRHHLFSAACHEVQWSARQAWLGYLSLGGRCDFYDVDAFLEGLTTLNAHEQDILAVAVNERLHDLYRAHCVPYLLTPTPDAVPGPTPLEAIADLLVRDQQDGQDREP